MFNKFIIINLTVFLIAGVMITSSAAQTYEPVYRPDVKWKEINTERFRVIFPETAEKTAQRSLRILESQYEEIQELVGGELNQFPVVLNDYNDRSGGLVTTNHFRIEVEAPPRRSKTLNPRTGGWLELVMPHELVHALHLSVIPDISLARLIQPIAPDIAKTFHLTAPFGLLEGIAVYHESNVRPGEGGRGNHPYFTNQIKANFDSDERWSIGELVYPSARTRPGGRHYFGGYAFTQWLHEEYGDDTTREIIEDLNKWFFLGYGVSLRRVTGKWPWQLEREYQQYKSEIYTPENDSIRQEGLSPYELLPTEPGGALISRPKFLSEDEIGFYGSFYNERAGLWRYNRRNQSMDRIYTGIMTENYQYSMVEDHKLIFSRPVTHPYHENTWTLELFEVDLRSGSKVQLTEGARVHDPQNHGDVTTALQTHQQTSQWVLLDNEEVADTLLNIYPDHISEIEVNPVNSDEVAIAANINGKQALWLVDRSNPQIDKSQPDVAISDASVFDLSWHPEGEKLMFSSDADGVMNIYEWRRSDDSVYQITNTLYNAFEGSYHPNGDEIVFVIQRTSTREPATLHRDDFFDREIEYGSRQSDISRYVERDRVGDDKLEVSEDWQTEDYRTGFGWLRPRAVYPIAEFQETFPYYNLGATVASGDVLRRNRYELSLSYTQQYLWYDVGYTRRGNYPGFHVRAFSSPSSSGNIGLQNQGVSLGTQLPYTIENNLYFTSFSANPELRYSRYRAIYQEDILPQPSDWVEQYRASVRFNFAWRLQQNLQDMQPNTGIQVYNQWFTGYTQEFGGLPDFAVSGGLFGYLSPLRRFNQSLRLGAEFQYSSGILLNQSGYLSPGFQLGDLPDTDQIFRFTSRYTIPFFHADRAWLLLPSQLQTVYGVLFTNTIGPLDAAIGIDDFNTTRTVFGTELRTRFELFNVTFDAGVRVGYEPTRGDYRITFVL